MLLRAPGAVGGAPPTPGAVGGVPPIIEVDLGSPGDPLQPVREAFGRRGVRISDGLITRLRSGTSRPAGTEYRLACGDRLWANDAWLKTQYCLRVLSVGRERRQPSPEPPRVYTCIGLTRAMGAALGCTHLELSYVLRTMRADLALSSARTRDDQLVAEFRETASLFLRVHGPHRWREMHGVNDLVDAAWDQQTIHGFYVALYAIAGSLTRASWLPYELDLLRNFYLRQHQLGDPLTPLDREALASAANRKPTRVELSGMVRAHVGVEYDESCVTTHRHLLVTGSPKPLRGSRAG